MPCASWPALDKLPKESEIRRGGKKWLAKIREKNRTNQAALDLKKTRRRQSRRSRVRSEWLIFVGTTARPISSSRAGNGSLAGAAERSFTRRKTIELAKADFRFSY